MSTLSILKKYNPVIKCINDNEAQFDAELDISLKTAIKLTQYPIESGANLTGNMIQVPSIIRMTLGVSKREIKGLISDEPLEALTENSVALASGFVSNFAAPFVTGLISNSLFQGEESSRAFKALTTMQQAQLAGQPLKITMHDVGTLPFMLCTEIELTRKGKAGDAVYFNLVFEQPLTNDESINMVIDAYQPQENGQAPLSVVDE